MVGRKFFMALLKEFQDLCRLLSCQKADCSPAHQEHKIKLDTVSEQVSKEDMGGSPTKLEGIESVHQDHVLDILRDGRTPLKETMFSPYTPLPAIGKCALDGSKDPPRILRQKTYRVLNPIYIKGPLDFYKFTSLQMIEDDYTGIEPWNSLENNRVRGKQRKNQVNKFLSDRRVSIKEVPESGSKKPWTVDKNRHSGQKRLDTKEVNNENTTAFWIEF